MPIALERFLEVTVVADAGKWEWSQRLSLGVHDRDPPGSTPHPPQAPASTNHFWEDSHRGPGRSNPLVCFQGTSGPCNSQTQRWGLGLQSGITWTPRKLLLAGAVSWAPCFCLSGSSLPFSFSLSPGFPFVHILGFLNCLLSQTPWVSFSCCSQNTPPPHSFSLPLLRAPSSAQSPAVPSAASGLPGVSTLAPKPAPPGRVGAGPPSSSDPPTHPSLWGSGFSLPTPRGSALCRCLTQSGWLSPPCPPSLVPSSLHLQRRLGRPRLSSRRDPPLASIP